MKKIFLLLILLVAGQMAAMQPRQPRNFDDLMPRITNLRSHIRELFQWHRHNGDSPRAMNRRDRRRRERRRELMADLYEIIDARLREIGPLPTWDGLITRLSQVEKNNEENSENLNTILNLLEEFSREDVPWSPKGYLEEERNSLTKKAVELRREIERLRKLVGMGSIGMGPNRYNNYRNAILPFINERNKLYRKVRDIIQERQERRRGAMERNFARRR